jgi:hypothetical protein
MESQKKAWKSFGSRHMRVSSVHSVPWTSKTRLRYLGRSNTATYQRRTKTNPTAHIILKSEHLLRISPYTWRALGCLLRKSKARDNLKHRVSQNESNNDDHYKLHFDCNCLFWENVAKYWKPSLARLSVTGWFLGRREIENLTRKARIARFTRCDYQ